MEPVEYTIRVSAALDAALHRRARETAVSFDQAVIDVLCAGLQVAAADDGQLPDPVADGADGVVDGDLPADPEQDALDEGVWL